MHVQPSTCTDDFGEQVFAGRYSGALVKASECIAFGPVIPGVKSKYFDAKGTECLHKESKRLFNETDANCNTCKHLRRIDHAKNTAGFLYGKCLSRIDESHPYKHLEKDGVMSFHPDDAMLMPCYEARA